MVSRIGGPRASSNDRHHDAAEAAASSDPPGAPTRLPRNESLALLQGRRSASPRTRTAPSLLPSQTPASAVLRNLRAERGLSALSSTAGASPIAPQTSSDLNVVQDVLQTIRRDVYRRDGQNGSSNLRRRGDARDAARAARAEYEIERFVQSEDPVAAALTLKALNCGPLSHLAQALLSRMGFEAKLYEEFAGADHAVVICSRGSVDSLPPDMKHWPAHVLVLDAQFDIACQASEYHSRFDAAMEALDRQGVEIFHAEADRWVRPTDDRWCRGILDVPDWH